MYGEVWRGMARLARDGEIWQDMARYMPRCKRASLPKTLPDLCQSDTHIGRFSAKLVRVSFRGVWRERVRYIAKHGDI